MFSHFPGLQQILDAQNFLDFHSFLLLILFILFCNLIFFYVWVMSSSALHAYSKFQIKFDIFSNFFTTFTIILSTFSCSCNFCLQGARIVWGVNHTQCASFSQVTFPPCRAMLPIFNMVNRNTRKKETRMKQITAFMSMPVRRFGIFEVIFY